MALAPVPAVPAIQASERLKKLAEELMLRRADARTDKSTIQNDLQNAYYYTAPRRVRQQSSAARSNSKPGDDFQLQTSFGMEVADAFATMLIETFMPREVAWAERQMPTDPDEDGMENPDVEAVNKLIRAEDKKIFDLIRSSNFYAELAKQCVPDSAIGVIAMLVDSPRNDRAINCLAVSVGELDFDLGPDGRPDFRSITRSRKYRHLKAVLGQEVSAKLPDEIARKVREQPDAIAEISWGWWRVWENFGDVEWQHVITVDGTAVHDARSFGEGSCALIVGRFGATPDFAWPDGPLVKALPDLVALDEISGARIENVDFTLRPPKAYDDDSQINIPPGGLRPGDLVPKRPSFGKPAFEDIYEPRPIDAAVFETEHLQMRIRRLHYVDFPEQRGKTPPTATQWIDELVLRQQRIGRPGYAFWREFPFDIFQRFRHLGERRGSVRSAEALGVPGNVALQPYNPAERAQDSQNISMAIRFAEIGQAVAPTMWQVMLDEAKTLLNIKGAMREELVVMRSEEEAEERIKLLTSLGAEMLANGGGEQQGGGA